MRFPGVIYACLARARVDVYIHHQLSVIVLSIVRKTRSIVSPGDLSAPENFSNAQTTL